MEKINEFYKDILEVLGLEVTSSGGIFLSAGKTKLPISVNGLPMVLPTEDNIKNIIDTSGDKPEIKYFLFNPGYEDPVKKSTSLQKLRELIYRRLENKIASIMEILAIIGLENNGKSSGIEEFIELTLRFKNKNIKKLFDDAVVENVRNIYKVSKKSANPKLNLMHVFLNKGNKIGEERYNRIANTAFPIYETLINDFSVKNDTIGGVTIRNKDKGVIISAYEFIVKNPDDLVKGMLIGSKNKVAPGLHSLLVTMYMLIDMVNTAIESLKEDIEEDVYNSIKMSKPKLTMDELDDFITNLKGDIEYIPKEKDLEILLKNGGKQQVAYAEPTRTNIKQNTIQQTYDPVDAGLNSQPTYPEQQMMIPQPVQPMQQGYDPLSAGLNQSYGYQQPMVPQPQPMNQGYDPVDAGLRMPF